MRQHYIPVSFLKRWANANGDIIRYGMPRDELRTDRKKPTEVCYVKDAWTLGPEVTPSQRQFVEKQLTSIVDTKSARVFRAIDIKGIRDLNAEDVYTVAAFCSSLMARSPGALELLKQGASNKLIALLLDEKSKLPADDPLLQKFPDPVAATRHHFPGLIENIDRLMLPKLSFGSKLIDSLANRQWCLFDFSSTSIGSIPLPDTGIACIGGRMDAANSVVVLPIGPTKVLYFASAEMIQTLIRTGAGRLGIATIETIVLTARMFVYGNMDVNANILERQFKAKRRV